jgi:hypothetical protein
MSLNAPALLWRWYAGTLVHYASDSWVASTASTFRVLAFLTIMPGILLTLLVRDRVLPAPCPRTLTPAPRT